MWWGPFAENAIVSKGLTFGLGSKNRMAIQGVCQ
jgi:hypothetical protein